MNMPALKNSQIHQGFYNFINEEVLPLCSINETTFWQDFEQLVADLTPRNQSLLKTRQDLQNKIDQWHQDHKGQAINQDIYQRFLKEIGYLVDQGPDFEISTQNVDTEIAQMSGPQLVVPITNERFALNAANARWGSLYDALYGTDVIAKDPSQKTTGYDQARGEHVIAYAKDFLDQNFPLTSGSHKDVKSYVVYYQHLLAFFPDGSQSGLRDPRQLVALCGSKSAPNSIVLKHNGLHVEVIIDRNGSIGSTDAAGVQDIQLEAALTTIMDFEDSVAAVDGEDKVHAYRNWLGLVKGDLTATFTKNGQQETRSMNPDRVFTTVDGDDYPLHGRSLMLARNVGHLMDTELMRDAEGNLAPEGIIDAVVTALIGKLDLEKTRGLSNSRTGSIYIVKPKMHGPEEVAFTSELFERVEQMLGLEKNTIKLGIMDEERRTTVNLKACIREAQERLVFINTGFLDRTGDEIHTSMHAGAVLPKNQIKQQPWIRAYEQRNVSIGLKCGLPGRAQIGKGMWAMPDEMKEMMKNKIDHPRSGATTAWVPSPTAATLHALHYHRVDVSATQQQIRLQQTAAAGLSEVLTIPLMTQSCKLSDSDIERELENNIQGILGYVVRWVELGIGCSKVPDIDQVGLMEDRATLRISSQHIANWLEHGICDQEQVDSIMARMAEVVDAQNSTTAGYMPMSTNLGKSLAYQAARELIVAGKEQPNGYTEPVLHHYRCLAKAASN